MKQKLKAWADSWSASPLERISHTTAWAVVILAVAVALWGKRLVDEREKLIIYYEAHCK